MKIDNIKEIKIDEAGRLCIYHEREKFTLVYRTATDVHWNNEKSFLYSPSPREWSYFDWYKHIINVARECGCELIVTKDTVWADIPPFLKQEIASNN